MNIEMEQFCSDLLQNAPTHSPQRRKLVPTISMFYTIKTIEPNTTNYSIKIIYSDNTTIIADFKELLEKGIMTSLKNPVVFNQVQIGNKGRSIIW